MEHHHAVMTSEEMTLFARRRRRRRRRSHETKTMVGLIISIPSSSRLRAAGWKQNQITGLSQASTSLAKLRIPWPP